MGTQNSRTDIPPRAGGGGARERRGIWTRSLAQAPGHRSAGRAFIARFSSWALGPQLRLRKHK